MIDQYVWSKDFCNTLDKGRVELFCLTVTLLPMFIKSPNLKGLLKRNTVIGCGGWATKNWEF